MTGGGGRVTTEAVKIFTMSAPRSMDSVTSRAACAGVANSGSGTGRYAGCPPTVTKLVPAAVMMLGPRTSPA